MVGKRDTFLECDSCSCTFGDSDHYGFCSGDQDWGSDYEGPTPEGWDEFVGCGAIFCGNCWDTLTRLQWGGKIVGCVLCSKVPSHRNLGVILNTRGRAVRREVEAGRMIDDTLCTVCKKESPQPLLLTSGICRVCLATTSGKAAPKKKRRRGKGSDHSSAYPVKTHDDAAPAGVSL